MASARTLALLRQILVALLLSLALATVAVVALRLYAERRLETAESRFLAELEARASEPVPSSPESLELGERIAAAVQQLPHQAAALRRAFDSGDPEALAALAPQIEVFLAAAELTPAYESILRSDGRASVSWALRLLDRAAEEAAGRGDEARQVRCAEALSGISAAAYESGSIYGLLLGAVAEKMALRVVQRLVEDPATSAQAIARSAALLAAPPPQPRTAIARETLELLRFEPPPDEEHPLAPLRRPVSRAVADLMRASLLERSGEPLEALGMTLPELIEQPPDSGRDRGLLDIYASSMTSNLRGPLIEMKTMEVIRELARQALAARRSGAAARLSRPEISAALDRFWGHSPGDELPRGRARTRALLDWRVSG